MNRLLNIARYLALAVLLPALFSLAPTVDKVVVRLGDITTLSVDSVEGESYSWEIYNDSTVDFAVATATAVANGEARFVNDENTGGAVQVQWLKTGIYFYKVTAWNVTGCTNNLRIGIVKVVPEIPTAKLTTTPICEGDPLLIHVSLTGTPEWSFTITDGKNSWDFSAVPDTAYDAVINPPPKIPTSYWVTHVQDPWGENITPSDTVLQVVNPKPATSVIYLKP